MQELNFWNFAIMVTHAWGHQEKREEKNAKEKNHKTDVSGEKDAKRRRKKGNCNKNQKKGK